eukprot:TRINITY_DN70892_c0_g1_i1.p1 TRINITY_DN70892_c0_g1~~TRINITY_DN70892_c0_g1_i1.p1  ORF type:complete len:497 (+),score=145.12 TRINITY_DN70892_c0_g1_i1:109-1491(+)
MPGEEYERLTRSGGDDDTGTDLESKGGPAAADPGPPPPLAGVVPASGDRARRQPSDAPRAPAAQPSAPRGRTPPPRGGAGVPVLVHSPRAVEPGRSGYSHRVLHQTFNESLRWMTWLWGPLSLMCGLQWDGGGGADLTEIISTNSRRQLLAKAWSLSALTATVVYGVCWEVSRWAEGLPDMERSYEPWSRIGEIGLFVMAFIAWVSGTRLFAKRGEVTRDVLLHLPLHKRNIIYCSAALVGGGAMVILNFVAYTATLTQVPSLKPHEVVMWLALTWANLTVTVQCALYMLCSAHIIDIAEQFEEDPPSSVQNAEREYYYMHEKVKHFNQFFGPFLTLINICTIARYCCALVWRHHDGSLPWPQLALSVRWVFVSVALDVVAVKVYRSQQAIAVSIAEAPFHWTPEHWGLFNKVQMLQYRTFFDPTRINGIAMVPTRFWLLLSYYVAATTYLVPEVTKIWQ